MTYRIALPVGGRSSTLDVIDPNSTAIQRVLRRHGLAGYEPATAAALLATFERSDPGFGFFDVGANIGLYACLCAAMFDPDSVVAVEPESSLADLAERIADRNGLTVAVWRAAASAAEGTAELHVSDATDVSHSLEAGFKASATSVRVETVSLDGLRSSTGVDPSVVKIDVEGHEAAVLDGAGELLSQCRPIVVVEVLNRRGGRLAEAIATSIDGLGYHCYELSAVPDWHRHDRVVRRDGHRDWLLAPEPVDHDFVASWEKWRERLSTCTAERNSRVPLLRTSWAAFRRGGLSEVRASFVRFRRR